MQRRAWEGEGKGLVSSVLRDVLLMMDARISRTNKTPL